MLEELTGKTIAKAEEQWDEHEHRGWIVVTFTDGTTAKFLGEGDYSDMRAWVTFVLD